MVRIVGKLTCAVLLALLGCSQTNIEQEKNWLSFRCPDGRSLLARFEPKDEFVDVRFDEHNLRLPHVISGSGVRYSDGKTTFWNKGKSALVEVDNKIVAQDCVLE